MLKKEIFLSNGESDGHQYEYCDVCGAEAATKFLNDCYQCTDCRNKERDKLEDKFWEIHYKWEEEHDERKAKQLLEQLTEIENQIDAII